MFSVREPPLGSTPLVWFPPTADSSLYAVAVDAVAVDADAVDADMRKQRKGCGLGHQAGQVGAPIYTTVDKSYHTIRAWPHLID